MGSKQIFQFLLMTILCILYTNAEGISCFKCVVTPSGEEDSNLLCSHFDGSEKYQVFCPSSTFCRKKTVYYAPQSSVIKTVQRDCAPQKDTFHSYSHVDKKWHKKEEIVKTAYDEGCFLGADRSSSGRPPEYCYCGFHLCNFAFSVRALSALNIFLITMAMVINI